VTTVPQKAEMEGALLQLSLRVTSRGNALLHEMREAGKPDDPNRYDHPVTMLYLDSDRLYLTHYCDAGNRPRMVATTSPDGKIVQFDLSTSPAARNTDTCTMPCSRSSTPTITPRTGLTWNPATSRYTRTLICSAQNSEAYFS